MHVVAHPGELRQSKFHSQDRMFCAHLSHTCVIRRTHACRISVQVIRQRMARTLAPVLCMRPGIPSD